MPVGKDIAGLRGLKLRAPTRVREESIPTTHLTEHQRLSLQPFFAYYPVLLSDLDIVILPHLSSSTKLLQLQTGTLQTGILLLLGV